MSAEQTMRAVVLTGHGDLDRLVYHEDWPRPVPGAGEVLIRVAACGLNNTDVNTRTAWYSKGIDDATTGGALEDAQGDDASWGGASIRFPLIQGADVAGRVEAVGEGADTALVGRRVLVDTWLRDWDDPSTPIRPATSAASATGASPSTR
jgi:NADPH:quinone reductase-like Zn-dependent oxidoreductase